MTTQSTPATPTVSTNFFASGLRQKVDQLMDILWSGGVNNPMDSIEQISYLYFLRLLSEKDDQLAALSKGYRRIFSGQWARFAWGNFVTLTGDELFDSVRGALERIHELPGLSETGRLLFRQATLKIYDRPTLRAVVQAINEIDSGLAHPGKDGVDLKGDMYEYLLSRIAMSGTNGQFRTPRHIIDMIVAMVDPKPGERICDPAVGTAGFLLAAFRHILATNTAKSSLAKGVEDGSKLSPAQWRFLEEQAFTGFDNDANMVKLAIMNLYLHGLEKAHVEFFNPLTTNIGGSYPGATYDVVLTNPPFSGSIQAGSVNSDINLPTRATELLFVKWVIDHLGSAGRVGIIVPHGVLFGSNKAAVRVRELLLTQCDLQAVVSLPSGVFKPYSTVITGVLILQRGGPTKKVWFYDLKADGFSLSDTRTPIDANDIPNVLGSWPSRLDGPNSFSASYSELAERNYELLPARYREHSIESADRDPPSALIEDILDIEAKIAEKAKELRKSLKR